MMRRRPLARAAVVGGVAYHAGKRGAQNSAAEAVAGPADRGSPGTAGAAAVRATAAAVRSPAARCRCPAAGGDDMVAQLENLKKLLDEGILTQAEFDMQKQKLLAGA